MTRPSARRRLDRSERRAHLLDLAGGLIVRRGHLPVPIDQLAAAAGVSKALIYSYFPTQHRLFGALLERLLPPVLAAQRLALAQAPDPAAAAVGCAAAYFGHVAEDGPLLHILLSDLYAVDGLDAGVLRAPLPVVLALARRLRSAAGLPPRDSVAAVHLMMALVEEAGTLVHRGQVRREVGLSTCLALVRGALANLSEAGGVPAGGADQVLPATVGDRA